MELHYSQTSIPGLYSAKARDLSYFRFGQNSIVIACDSSGSIGELEKDAYHATSAEAGVNMVEVPLKEILCVGARPLAVYLDFCYAKNQAADDFLASVHRELQSVGVDVPVFVTYGSYKRPRYSSLGLTIIAAADESRLRIGTSAPGDLVYAIGLPRNKDYYDLQTRTATLARILALDYVHEMLPCGSHGILYEANELAQTNGLSFIEGDCALLNAQNARSCGASAVALFTIPADQQAALEAIAFPRELNLYGTLTGSCADTFHTAAPAETVHADLIQVLENGTICFPDGYCICSTAAVNYGEGEQDEDVPVPGGVEAISLRLAEQALAELTAHHASPFLLINNLNFGMNPLGKRTIHAIREFLLRRDPDIDLDAQFTGSTEDNFPTGQSGFAVHVFGLRHE